MLCSPNIKIRDEIIEDFLSLNFGLSPCNDTILSYLGMSIDTRVPGVVAVSSVGYIRSMIDRYGVVGSSNYPCDDQLLIVNAKSTLSNEMKSTFLSAVMSIMYVAKRVRPDVLFATSWLATRSKVATE